MLKLNSIYFFKKKTKENAGLKQWKHKYIYYKKCPFYEDKDVFKNNLNNLERNLDLMKMNKDIIVFHISKFKLYLVCSKKENYFNISN